MLTGSKSPATSLGVWGGAVAAIAGLGGLVGYALTPEDVAQLGQQADTVAAGAEALIQSFASLVAMIGGVLAVVGRIRATRRIVVGEAPGGV